MRAVPAQCPWCPADAVCQPRACWNISAEEFLLSSAAGCGPSQPLGASIPREAAPAEATRESRSAFPRGTLHRHPHIQRGNRSRLCRQDASRDGCGCRKTRLCSLLFGKFGELPKSASLREQKLLSRVAAEHRGPGLLSLGTALARLTAAPAGKQLPVRMAAKESNLG